MSTVCPERTFVLSCVLSVVVCACECERSQRCKKCRDQGFREAGPGRSSEHAAGLELAQLEAEFLDCLGIARRERLVLAEVKQLHSGGVGAWCEMRELGLGQL